jgi:hypothetical protein
MAKLGRGGQIGIGAAVLALLTAIVNKNTGLVNSAFGDVVSWITGPTQTFDKHWNELEELAERGTATMLPTVRDKADDEYSVANGILTGGTRTADKCRVVRLFSERQDWILVLGLPDDAYSDYEQKVFSKSCYTDVENAAGHELSEISEAETQAGVAHLLGLLEKQARRQEVYQVLAQAAERGDAGWIPVAVRAAGDGSYVSRQTVEVPAKAGKITIASGSGGLPVHMYARDRPLAGIAGWLANGSTALVLALESFKQDGSNRYDIWANVKVVSPNPLSPVGVRRASTHLQFTHRVAAQVAMSDPPNCPPLRQNSSLHSAKQLWVWVGEKPDTNKSDAFVPGTSRINNPCIPRDGETVQAVKDLPVFVGSDPYYPGVHPQGGIVVAGAQFRVVGDVSGYPFDATADPGFCGGNPPPSKSKALPVIPAGHIKRYCVYLPISPA